MSSQSKKRNRQGHVNPPAKMPKLSLGDQPSRLNFDNIWKKISKIKTSGSDTNSESSDQDQQWSSDSDDRRSATRKKPQPNTRRKGKPDPRQQSSSDEDDVQSLSDDIVLTSDEAEQRTTKHKSTPETAKLSERQEIFEKYGNPDRDENCFACMWGRCPSNATSDLQWNGMIKLYQEKVNRCRRLDLCEKLHEYYETIIRRDTDLPEWSVSMIHEHFFRHVKDSRVVFPQVQGELANLLRSCMEYMTECDDSGQPNWITNPKTMTQARTAVTMLRSISKDLGPPSSSMLLPQSDQNVFFIDYPTLALANDHLSY